jgi:hypothetical protein
MHWLSKAVHSRERGAALIIVLAFVVLLTGVAIAYLSRATSDRQVAHSSFNQSNVDQLAQSAMDSVIGNLRQEIANGSDARIVASSTVYVPKDTAGPPARTANDNMLPVSNAPTTIPNLVRISVRSDGIPFPAVPSRASAVNSTSDASANGRSVSLPRWNKHYLIPRPPGTDPSVTTPIADFASPDWVFVSNTDALTITTPNPAVIGRYAYAIYDEGGLLDANVAGYPNNLTAAQYGRKGVSAFADLTVLGLTSPGSVDNIVGWRNCASAKPGSNFPTFTFTTSTQANDYVNSVLSNTNGFMTVRATRSDGTDNVWVSGSGGTNAAKRTDQMFPDRQTLIKFRASSGFNANALQYLGTFSRELNAPIWKPSTPTGSSIDYANLASIPTPETSTAINRQLLSVRVGDPGGWTRFDGGTAAAGEPLIERRFPLSRLAWITYKGPSADVYAANSSDPLIVQLLANNVSLQTIQLGTAANIQTCFGLIWVPPVSTDPATGRWNYVGASGSTVQTTIERLDQVAAENREPNFFELLKATILSGSVGVGSGPGNTFVAAEAKYYDTSPTSNLSSDYQIMQIGANIIDQADPDSVPTFINFASNELAGVENLPYLNKLVFKPYWKTTGPPPNTFDAWLLPSLWNPHQNAVFSTGNVRIAMPNTAQTMTARITLNVTPFTLTTTTPVVGSPTQFMTVDASRFGTSPSGATSTAVVGTPPSSITLSTDPSPGGYYGFHFPFPPTTGVTPSNTLTAYPDFGASGCDFEMQVQVSTSPVLWKAYQRWKGCGPLHPLVCQSPPSWTVNTLQDPEFLTLDPRMVRFGVWGNAGIESGVPTDYTSGVLTTLETSAGVFERITALPPQGTRFSSPTSTDLYKYANNLLIDTTVHYTDLDGVQRQGDLLTSGATTAMLPTDSVDRPRILNRPFQSVAELGEVFRDQPWKTLDFTTTASADAGLLDVFTLHESGIEAGKTSLNTRQSPILTAILSQATKRLDGTSVITSTERNNIVTALFTLISAQPMISKTQVLTQLAADPSVTGLGNKEARELVMRAFSDACQTRTWNLMLDVIAQSGRFKPNAASLQNDFVVDGGQRYWVHVAIDRFTGQVIDKQIEVVTE